MVAELQCFQILELPCEKVGQMYQQCKECPATCSNPALVCTFQCEPGCGCSPRQLINNITDEKNPKCVDPEKCPIPPICAVSIELNLITNQLCVHVC